MNIDWHWDWSAFGLGFFVERHGGIVVFLGWLGLEVTW